MDYITAAREILKDTSIPWLELDINFDTSLWQQQAAEAEAYYTEYRDGASKGWSSCCLHGLGVDKIYTADNYGMNEYHAPYAYTDLAYRTPAITDFWRFQFPAERYTRIRFMKLSARGHIDWHDDGKIPDGIDPLQSILPINLAIVHPDTCTMHIKDHGTVPWRAGKVIMVNISKPHAVFNNSEQDRIHMIANVILGNRTEEFCQMLVRSYNKNYGQIRKIY
jgi:hypothetical protein